MRMANSRRDGPKKTGKHPNNNQTNAHLQETALRAPDRHVGIVHVTKHLVGLLGGLP
jgi:hypothetical protein